FPPKARAPGPPAQHEGPAEAAPERERRRRCQDFFGAIFATHSRVIPDQRDMSDGPTPAARHSTNRAGRAASSRSNASFDRCRFRAAVLISSSASLMTSMVAQLVTIALRERAWRSRTDYANGILVP